MSRTSVRVHRRRLAVLVGVPALVLTLWGPAAGAFSGPPAHTSSHRHVVVSGETLWSIARSEADPGVDPRPLVDAIVEANSIDADAIVPGQALAIPAGA